VMAQVERLLRAVVYLLRDGDVVALVASSLINNCHSIPLCQNCPFKRKVLCNAGRAQAKMRPPFGLGWSLWELQGFVVPSLYKLPAFVRCLFDCRPTFIAVVARDTGELNFRPHPPPSVSSQASLLRRHRDLLVSWRRATPGRRSPGVQFR